jgi:hypothetical protein
MRNFHLKKTSLKHYLPTINVEQIWSLVGDRMRENLTTNPDGKAPVIDVIKHVLNLLNVFKLLVFKLKFN